MVLQRFLKIKNWLLSSVLTGIPFGSVLSCDLTMIGHCVVIRPKTHTIMFSLSVACQLLVGLLAVFCT